MRLKKKNQLSTMHGKPSEKFGTVGTVRKPVVTFRHPENRRISNEFSCSKTRNRRGKFHFETTIRNAEKSKPSAERIRIICSRHFTESRSAMSSLTASITPGKTTNKQN